MDNQESVLGDKAWRARGDVHRPSHASVSSTGSRDALSNVTDPTDSGDDGVAGSSQSPVTNLPPYSSPSDSSLNHQALVKTPKGAQYYPGLPILDYRQYSPPLFELSADATTITSKATYLAANATALSTLIKKLATVPPKPQVQITGNRGSKVDFSIKLNLLSLLIPDDPSQRMDYLRLIKKDEMGYRGGQRPSLQPEINNGSLEDCKQISILCSTFSSSSILGPCGSLDFQIS